MENLQVVLFGLLVGGMITFLGIFLRQRHSSVRRRLQAKPRLNTDLMRSQMAGEPVFISAKLSETLEKKFDLTKSGATTKNSRQSSSRQGFTLNGPFLCFSG